MRGRVLLLLVGAVGAAVFYPLVLIPQLHKLKQEQHGLPSNGLLFGTPTTPPPGGPEPLLFHPPTPHPHRPGSQRAGAPARAVSAVTAAASARHAPKAGATATGLASAAGRARRRSGSGSWASALRPALSALRVFAFGLAILAGLFALLSVRRLVCRRRREYALYQLHLSAHDEAKGQDLEDLMEQVANIVCALPGERVRDGQPFVAFELICDRGEGIEWSLNVRCEPRVVEALDAAFSATYPDVRIGRVHAEPHRPRHGRLREPGWVMRFRKERSFVYPLLASGDELASPPLEQIARSQVALGKPSVVRFQLWPTPSFFEEYARRRYKRHESKLVRQERWGLPEGGLLSTLNRAEMNNAQRTQNRSLFWIEAIVAADSIQACKTVAAAVQSRRGENRLHRRWMLARVPLYRKRFPRSLGPLLPSPRCLVSAAEVAHLLELPTARMKAVPVRRQMLPRIPAPPDVKTTTLQPAQRPELALAHGNVTAGRDGVPVLDLGAGERTPALYPMLRAENAQVAIHPHDRKYGVLVAGGQGSGKTSLLLSMYRSDVLDTNTAVIVADPKSELSRLCLAHTPPECGKRLWYLDLGRPAFGMNPLIPAGERPIALEAAEIAENIVAALLDVNEGQIYASSRRYLTHAVIGALALAEQENRRPTFEDMQRLLEPALQELRDRAGQACSQIPDLDATAHFLGEELPNDLRMATSQTAMRLDAPRNKIAALLQVAPIRRFFHHPTNNTLREIIESRDILIVDCAQGQVGDDNVRPMLMFILRMLHRQMQRQVTLPENQRPRVATMIDEAHYVINEHFVDQIATHRRAGLEMACGIQYFGQLGSGSEHQEKIRKGILNLLQSRCLFRMGDVDDAQEATRIAMAVYVTMIRDDPDSRARMRVTPEQLLTFPNHHCLASWIAGGTRVPSFTGQTYPLPDHDPGWAKLHLDRQAKRVGPYPETLQAAFPPPTTNGTSGHNGDNGDNGGNGENGSRGRASAAEPAREYLLVPYEEKDHAKQLGARWDRGRQQWYIPAGVNPQPLAKWRAHPVDTPTTETTTTTTTTSQTAPPTTTTASEPTTNANSHGNTSEVAGNASDRQPRQPGARGTGRVHRIDEPPSQEPRELGFPPSKREVRVDYQPPPPPPKLDNSPVRQYIGHPTVTPVRDPQAPAPDSLRELSLIDRITEIGPPDQSDGAGDLPRLYDEDYSILALLDRAGLASRSLIGRATLPDKVTRTVVHRLTKLHQHGLIAQHTTLLGGHTRDDGTPPLLYSLTRRGLEVAQTREPPAISRKREWRGGIDGGRASRLAHDLHALGWAIELHRVLGELATDHWRTPRYATGRYPVPQAGTGRDRHPVAIRDIKLPHKQWIGGLELAPYFTWRRALQADRAGVL